MQTDTLSGEKGEIVVTYTTHRIRTDRPEHYDDALDIVLDHLATWLTAEDWGEHSDATLGTWVLKWSHATKEERKSSIWVYAIEDEDGNVTEAFFTTGETIYRVSESVFSE